MSQSDEALALLEKYRRKPHQYPPVPPELAPLLKSLSDCAQNGRPLGRESLLAELAERGHKVSRQAMAHWITEAGGTPWFK